MGVSTSLLTFEEFALMPEPDEAVKEELLDGELIQVPPPFIDHMDIAHQLHELLTPLPGGSNRPVNLGRIYIETGYKIGSNSWLTPDVSVTHARQRRDKYLEGAPALAVEVIGESNTAERMDRKVKKYLANGGIEVWVAYPKTQCVWVFRRGYAKEFCGELRSDFFPGVTIDLVSLFTPRPA